MTTDFNEAIVTEFVLRHLNTLIKWDIARFFQENPFAVEPAQTVAEAAMRSPQQLEQALTELAADGILVAEDRPGMRVYRLADDDAIRAAIAEFVRACDQKEVRARLIQAVVARGG
jgi:DNA-binding transcriptional ArsR family regulator